MFFVPLYGFAQGTLSLSVTPALYDIAVDPAQEWNSVVRIINSNPYELTVYTRVVNFQPKGESGQGEFVPILSSETDGGTLAEWVTINNRPLTIPAEQSVDVPFKVIIPDDAPPGGHFAAILVGTEPPPSEEVVRVRTSQIVTSLLFLNVSGDIVEDGHIRSFAVAKSILNEPVVDFSLRFENRGNIHLRPEGNITIYNMWGKERGVIPINRQTNFGNVLPESIRKFDFSWQTERTFSDIGRYKAVVSLAYGSEERKFESRTVYFWVIPFKAVGITLGSLLAFIIFMAWAIKLYVRHMLQMAGVDPAHYRPASRRVTEDGDLRVVSYKNISAPVRAGAAEFQNQLSASDSIKGKLGTLGRLFVRYKWFFVTILVIVVGVYSAIMFLTEVNAPERSYEVTIDDSSAALKIESEKQLFDAQINTLGIDHEWSNDQQYSLEIVNASGKAGTGANAAVVLVESGVYVKDVRTEFNRIDRRTVIVYDPQFEATALQISRLLNNALLSARTSSSTTAANVTIFTGADLIEK